MKRLRATVLVFVAAGGLATALLGACSSHKTFDNGGGTFAQDASATAIDAPSCLSECSLDGRSVIDTCTGAVQKTCAKEEACGAAVCQAPCAAAAADRSSNGCEFWFQPPIFAPATYQPSCYATYVVNASPIPANLTLEYQGKDLDIAKSVFTTKPGDPTLIPHSGPVLPGESAILFVSDGPQGTYNPTPCPEAVVPATRSNGLPDGTGIGVSFNLKSDAPVGLAAIYPYGGAASYEPSATLLLPLATWGTQHIIVNAWEAITVQFGSSSTGPASQIVASEDGTDVTIRPTHDIQDAPGVLGTAAFVPATYHLNRGQVLQIDQFEELSGSVVTSNKPTAVFGGHDCMYIPSWRQACDIALQQLPPLAQWGSEYVGVGYRPRLGNEHEPVPYRIVAARDGTRLDYDPAPPPGAPVALSAGQLVTFYSGTGDAFTVRTQDADHPVFLAANMTGGGSAPGNDFLGSVYMEGLGDPEFVNVIPGGQYQNAYSFFADVTYEDTSLVIVRAKLRGKFEDVWLECAGGNLTDWKTVGTRGDYQWTRVDLAKLGGTGQVFGKLTCTRGLQRMHSAGPFTATLWGWGQYASYAYPGGTAQRKLVPTPLPSVR